MSLKGGMFPMERIRLIEDMQKGKKGVAERISKYAKDGVISTELYGELVEKYGAIPQGENPHRVVQVPRKSENIKALLKVFRNILSIIIGLITYVITEFIITHIFFFLLKIPVLSFLMTGIIPVDIFLSASVVTTASFATIYIIRLISSYKSTNYSVVILFLMLLIFYIVAFITKISATGFDFTKLTSALIFIGTYIVCCFMANE